MKFKLSKKIIFSSFILLIISVFFCFNIIYKPFPFFKVDYIYEKKKFNSDPLKDTKFYKINISKNTNLNFDSREEILQILHSDIFTKIKLATRLTRTIQEGSLGNVIKTYDNILSKNTMFQEICSESSKIFLYIMSALGENVRVLWLNGHTINEVWHNNSWIFVDPSSNTLAYNNQDKKFVSFLDILENSSSVQFKNIIEERHKLWDYRSDPEKLHNIIDSNNLIMILSNKNIFNFHTSEEKLKRIFSSLIFKSNHYAKQFITSKNTSKVGNVGLNIYKRIAVNKF